MFNSGKHRAGWSWLHRSLWAFVLLCACMSRDAVAAQPLVIGAVPGMLPPLELAQSPKAAPNGITADFVDAIAKPLDVAPQWRFFANRAAMIAALQKGDIDMATSATGDDPGPSLDLSHTYYPSRLVYVEPLAHRAPTRRLAYIDAQISPERLRAAYPSMTLVAYPDAIAAMLAVSFGDTDIFVGDVTMATYAIAHFDLPGIGVTGFALVDTGGFSFAFAANRPGSAALRDRVNTALAGLPDDFLITIRSKWHVATTAVTLDRSLDLTPAETAWIRAHPVVQYSMLSQNPPLMFRDAHGEPAGLAADLLRSISGAAGLRFKARIRDSFEKIDDDIRSGKSMFAPYGISPDWHAAALVLSTPFGESLLAIVTRAGGPPLRNGEALSGKRVAVPFGMPGQALMRQRAPDVQLVEVPSYDAQFRAVVDGKADAALIDLSLANYAVANPYRDKLVVSGVFSERPLPQGFLVAKDQPELLAILNRAIARMPAYEREALRGRWRLGDHPETLWERRRPQVELGAALGFAIVLVLIGWAVSLRAQILRRIAAEKAMRAAKEEAETANRAKSTFLATMSHEIRTPMNAVLGLIELELRAPGERAATERALATAHRAARDLLGMIDDLLDVAKIEAERLVLVPAPLELGAWIESVAAIYEPAARAKGIGLVVKRLGQSERAVWLLADGQRLRQVVGNLLSNAIKFTETGAVTLEYGAAPPHDRTRAVTLAVSDTGIGITPERQAALFAPFVQAHDDARRFPGTGLGLTICKRLVTMMNGTIAFESAAGRGTRFTVCVNLPEAEANAIREASAPPAPPVAADALAGLRVLVVDDHPANRVVLEGQIRQLGGVVELAADGHGALARWRHHPAAFDAILTDCSMPEMSGEDLAHAIRADEAASSANSPPVPILGLTANAQPDAARRAVEAGMTQCFVKPISLDELRVALVSIAPARVKPTPVSIETTESARVYDNALVNAFGERAGLLVDTLRSTNAQDLIAAESALKAGDYTRLHNVGHRMKGAAAIIGATSFVKACDALMHATNRAVEEDRDGAHDTDVAATYAAFHAAAQELDAALDSAIARPA